MTIATTNRLSLRRFELSDSAFVLKFLNEPSYHANIGDRGIRTLEQAEGYFSRALQGAYLEDGFGLYLVELKDEQGDLVPIGMCGLVNRDGIDGIDLGYSLLPSYWGNGYAKEACLAVMQHARQDCQLQDLWAIVSKKNEPSKQLLYRLGFSDAGDFLHKESGEILDLFRCDLTG